MADSPSNAKHWKEAIDPKTQRTYYYDKRTRETQWRKPLCLASPSERQAMIDKEKKQKDFFAEMEANILASLERGGGNGSVVDVNVNVGGRESESDDSFPDIGMAGIQRMTSASEPPMPSNRMVRTISSMDDLMIAELKRDENKKKAGENSGHKNVEEGSAERDVNSLHSLTDSIRSMSPDLVRDISGNSSSGSIPEDSELLNLPGRISTSPDDRMPMPRLMHRNSGGTIYVGTTMSAPDKDATIKCVCGVFRAHMVQATTGAFSQDELFEEYEIFNDKEYRRGAGDGEDTKTKLERTNASEKDVPSLEELHNFYRSIFTKSQMETDCIIMSLIYVERLLRQTKGGIRLRVTNWKSIIFSAMVMASKVWDDLSMWNADFSQVCSSFTLARINELELAMLDALKYDVKVLASEYAKYYFLLRSMLMKSGLGGDHIESLSPLSIDGAKQLQALSEEFQEIAATETLRRRAVSCSDMGNTTWKGKEGKLNPAIGKKEDPENGTRKPSKPNVSIEMLSDQHVGY